MNRELDLIEACYCPAPNALEWARNVALKFRPLMLEGEGDRVVTYTSSDENGVLSATFPVGTEAGDTAAAVVGPLELRAELIRQGLGATIIHAALSRGPAVAALASEFPEPSGSALISMLSMLPGPRCDAFAIVGQTGRAEMTLTAQLIPLGTRVPKGKRARLQNLAHHMRVGKRLHQMTWEQAGPEVHGAVAAVLAPDGSMRHRDPGRVDRQSASRLSHAAAAMDRARCRRKKSVEEVSKLWRAFIDGRYSLVEIFDSDGQRNILAVDTGLGSTRPKLSPREEQIVKLIAQGYSNKAAAYELGIAVSTVAVHLHSALRKLRCKNRSMLVRTVGVMRPVW